MLNPSCSELSPSRSLVLAASSRYEWASLFRDVFDTALDLSAATQAYDALALKLAQKRDAFRLARRRSLLESITTTHASEQRTSLSDDMVVDNVQHRLTAQDTRTPQRAERPPDEDDEVLAVVPDTPTDDIEDSPSLPNVRARGGGMWTSWAASHEVRVADDSQALEAALESQFRRVDLPPPPRATAPPQQRRLSTIAESPSIPSSSPMPSLPPPPDAAEDDIVVLSPNSTDNVPLPPLARLSEITTPGAHGCRAPSSICEPESHVRMSSAGEQAPAMPLQAPAQQTPPASSPPPPPSSDTYPSISNLSGVKPSARFDASARVLSLACFATPDGTGLALVVRKGDGSGGDAHELRIYHVPRGGSAGDQTCCALPYKLAHSDGTVHNGLSVIFQNAERGRWPHLAVLGAPSESSPANDSTSSGVWRMRTGGVRARGAAACFVVSLENAVLGKLPTVESVMYVPASGDASARATGGAAQATLRNNFFSAAGSSRALAPWAPRMRCVLSVASPAGFRGCVLIGNSVGDVLRWDESSPSPSATASFDVASTQLPRAKSLGTSSGGLDLRSLSVVPRTGTQGDTSSSCLLLGSSEVSGVCCWRLYFGRQGARCSDEFLWTAGAAYHTLRCVQPLAAAWGSHHANMRLAFVASFAPSNMRASSQRGIPLAAGLGVADARSKTIRAADLTGSPASCRVLRLTSVGNHALMASLEPWKSGDERAAAHVAFRRGGTGAVTQHLAVPATSHETNDYGGEACLSACLDEKNRVHCAVCRSDGLVYLYGEVAQKHDNL